MTTRKVGSHYPSQNFIIYSWKIVSSAVYERLKERERETNIHKHALRNTNILIFLYSLRLNSLLFFSFSFYTLPPSLPQFPAETYRLWQDIKIETMLLILPVDIFRICGWEGNFVLKLSSVPCMCVGLYVYSRSEFLWG